MKRNSLVYSAVLAAIVFLSSCVMVTYEYTMPKQSRVLDEFPQNYLGNYVAEDDSSGTLTITPTQFILPDEVGNIGENVEIKPYMSYLVINMKMEGHWVIYLAQKSKDDGSIHVLTIDPGEIEENLTELQQFTAVELVNDENNEFERVHIDPSDAEFKSLISSGLFEEVLVFKPVE